MAVYVKGDAVANATSYELFKKTVKLDSKAFGELSYKDIFITNNIAPNIRGNSMTVAVSGTMSYKVNGTPATEPAIVSNDVAEKNYVPPYALFINSTTSANIASWNGTTNACVVGDRNYFAAANIKVESRTAGRLGITLGDFNVAKEAVTEGYEVVANIGTSTSLSNGNFSIYVGSSGSANLIGYINNPVIVDMTIFGDTVPSLEELKQMYADFCNVAESEYVALSTGEEINFEVSAMGLSTGDHTFVVKAKADGYTDSEYSNEVTYTVE